MQNVITTGDKKNLDNTIVASQATNSFVEERQKIIDFLLSIGLPPLPVCPAQDPNRYPSKVPTDASKTRWKILKDENGNAKPRFTGKNPSYFDAQGRPRIVYHRDYQSKLPSKQELALWFADDRTGIGSLGGYGGFVWIDLDSKQFESLADCDRAYEKLLTDNPQLKASWLERTHSGGYRIAVKSQTTPSFTNFSLDSVGGQHHGEGLGIGRFTVLAPTIGVSGNAYENLNLAVPVEVENLESLGLFPVKKKKANKGNLEVDQEFDDFVFQKFDNKVSVLKLISKNAFAIYSGHVGSNNDRSGKLVSFLREIYGWCNWLSKLELSIEESVQSLVNQVNSHLGIDATRLTRIIESVNGLSLPAIHHSEGDLGCWRKFNAFFPDIAQEKYQGDISELQITPKKSEETEVKQNPKDQKFFYNVGDDVFTDCDSDVFESQKSVNVKQLHNWIERQRYTPDVVIESDKVVFPNDLDIKNSTIAVRAGMGLGKTVATIQLIKQETQKTSYGSVQLSPRIKLNAQFVSRCNAVEHQTYMLSDADSYAGELLINDTDNLALCPESTPKVENHAENRVIVFDEILSSASQIVGGGTASGSRQAHCLETLGKIIDKSKANVLLDANLTDYAVDLFQKFSPDKKVIKLDYSFVPKRSKITFIDVLDIDKKSGELKIKARDKSALVEKLLNPNCRPIIATDSKNFSEDLDTLLSDNNKWGFVLNRETSEETWNEMFIRNPAVKTGLAVMPSDLTAKWADELLENPGDFLEKYQPKYFIFSPTAECGLSIEKGDFTDRFGFFNGVIGINSIVQMLGRYRLDVPTWVYCPVKSLIPNEKLPSFEFNFLQEFEKEAIKLCIENDVNPNSKLIREMASQRVNPIWDEYRLRLKIDAEFERENLRACLIYKMRKFGWECEIIQEMTEPETKLELKEIRDAANVKRAEEIFEALPFSDRDEQEKAKKSKPGRETNNRMSKTYILNKVKGIEKNSLFSAGYILECYVKKERFIPETEKFWLLFNQEIADKTNEYFDYLKLGQQFVTSKSVLNSQKLELNALRELGIHDLINKLHDDVLLISHSSDEVDEIIKKAKSNIVQKVPSLILRKRRLDGSDKISYLKSILEKIGVHLKSHGKKISEKTGQREIFYELDMKRFNDPYRRMTLDGIENHYKDFLENEYKQPDWEFLQVNGRLPDKFRDSNTEEGNAVILQNSTVNNSNKNDVEINQVQFPIVIEDEEIGEEFFEQPVLTVARQMLNDVFTCVDENLCKTAARLLDLMRYEPIKKAVDYFDSLLSFEYILFS